MWWIGVNLANQFFFSPTLGPIFKSGLLMNYLINSWVVEYRIHKTVLNRNLLTHIDYRMINAQCTTK